MTIHTNAADSTIPVVDVDQVFPAMPHSGPSATSGSTIDQKPSVRAAIRDVLGIRSRTEDPKAFTDALGAVFRLDRVEGHVEAHYVPRGYAVQADLGAVTGGQASLYRRAMLARTEALRILDGLTPLRTDGDEQDMDAYRTIVRNGIQSLVDEMGAPGGPRVAMVDSYFNGLTGGLSAVDPDSIGGQLGALRERFGLIDDNVNTIEEEGIRTAFWTLSDMVDNLRQAWLNERVRFSGAAGQGFLGTELILLSRLMEAAADQVNELELVLDSVLIPVTERRTITLDDTTNLTLDGLLSWLSSFLSDEGRRLAQDAGRDGIVAGLAPTAAALYETFRRLVADPCQASDRVRELTEGECCPVRYLPTSCCTRWPAGMYAARVRVAVASLCRLLRELARRAQLVGRWAGVILIDVTVSLVDREVERYDAPVVNVEFRGLNLRPTYIPAFVPPNRRLTRDDCRLDTMNPKGLILPLAGSWTADEESISALFRVQDIEPIMGEADIWVSAEGVVVPASDVPIAVVDTETGQVVHAPVPATWPRLFAAATPRGRSKSTQHPGGYGGYSTVKSAPAGPGGPQGPWIPRRKTEQTRLIEQWAAEQDLLTPSTPATSMSVAMQRVAHGVSRAQERLDDRDDRLEWEDEQLSDQLDGFTTRRGHVRDDLAALRKELKAASDEDKPKVQAKVDALAEEQEHIQQAIADLTERRKQVREQRKEIRPLLKDAAAAVAAHETLEEFLVTDVVTPTPVSVWTETIEEGE
jgi:prefoldin subunit 5